MSDPLIPDAAVQAIKDSQATQTIELDGYQFLSRPIHLPPPEPTVDTLSIHTLTGLVAYLLSDVDDLAAENAPVYVQVKSPTKVDVLAPPRGRHQKRAHPLRAEAYQSKPVIGQYMNLEDAIINLQTAFVQTEQLQALLRVLGNVTDEKVGTFKDDGISQSVTVRQGISLAASVAVPNPIRLAPFRTFLEVEQPESLFAVRVRENGSNPPAVMLAEADGGAWQNEAIENIAAYLRERLEGKAEVIA